jgi:hypothetical protein
MAHTPLHARPDPVFIVAVVFLLFLWIAGAGLVGAIIGTLWMGAYPGGYLAWPGAIFGVLGFPRSLQSNDAQTLANAI